MNNDYNSHQSVRTISAHLDTAGFGSPAAAVASVTIEPLDSWSLPPATSLDPTTMCWSGDGAAALANPVALQAA